MAKMGEAGMRQFDIFSTANKKSAAPVGDLSSIIAVFRRRVWIIALTAALVFLAVAFYTASATKLYTATAEVQLSMQERNILGAIEAAQGMAPDAAKVDTESQIISSRSLVARVVDKLNLVDDPEFNKPVRKNPLASIGSLSAVRPSFQRLKRRANAPPAVKKRLTR